VTFTQTFGGGLLDPAQPSYKDYTTATANLSLSWPLETAPSNDVVAAINDIAFPTTGYTVTLAAATQISLGQNAVFNNRGSDAFSVVGATGAAILTASAGSVWTAYLVGQANTSGTWVTYQNGAGTSSASAAALAGYGLVAITTTLNQQYAASSTATTPTAIGVTNRAALITWTGGAGVFDLDAAATLTNGWFFNVYNGGTGALVITPTVGQTINGAASFTMNPGDSGIIVSDGTSAFYVIGFGQDSVFAFDYTAINVAGTGTYTLTGTELNRIAYKFTGLLTGNRQIVVPSTVQQYWADNSTTGAFTFTIQTATGNGVGISNGSTRVITYCNGTDVINADTQGISSPVQISEGGTSATTAAGARTNLDVPQTLEAFTWSLVN
jgi:hypothetical protein